MNASFIQQFLLVVTDLGIGAARELPCRAPERSGIANEKNWRRGWSAAIIPAGSPKHKEVSAVLFRSRLCSRVAGPAGDARLRFFVGATWTLCHGESQPGRPLGDMHQAFGKAKGSSRTAHRRPMLHNVLPGVGRGLQISFMAEMPSSENILNVWQSRGYVESGEKIPSGRGRRGFDIVGDRRRRTGLKKGGTRDS